MSRISAVARRRRCRWRHDRRLAGLGAALFHLFLGVDAPEAFLRDEAVKALSGRTLTGEPTPTARAFLDPAQHTGLQLRHHVRRSVAFPKKRNKPIGLLRLDHPGAAA